MTKVGRLLAFFFLAALFPKTALMADCSDVPDPYYEDTNGDGIDGDSSIAVFVSNAVGNDLNPGTMSQPVQTIQQGITLASSSGRKHVYVAGGIYNLGFNPVRMKDGISVYGQYSGPPAWGRSGANTTTLIGITEVVLAESLTVETHLEGFSILSTVDPTNRTGYGIVVTGKAGLQTPPAANGNFYIRYNSILPGAGIAGTNGNNGGAGPSGGAGGPGLPGSCDGSNGPGGVPGTSACGRTGGNGGNGGPEGSNNGFSGGTGVGGTPGGIGGIGCIAGCFSGCTGGPGNPGVVGAIGLGGGNGTGGSGYTINFFGLYSAQDGLAGSSSTSGNGGGGGGGGGGQGGCSVNDGGGNGAGGGGGGGCGGGSGIGGQGGGGSLAIFINNASAIIDGNFINTGSGGKGGDAGSGGIGGLGGSGGPGATNCTGEVGAGGNGGNGGAGGAGGSGGGGSGGASIGILSSSPAVVVIGSTDGYSIGSGGVGGSAPNPGTSGISASVVGNSITMTPAISTVVPSSGSPGDSITINGSNFDPTPANNRVCFGGGQATVLSASANLLLVEIPGNATSGHIRLAVNYLETYSPSPFVLCAGAKGDMNADANLSPADVVSMLNCVYLASGTCDLCFADVNCSGNLSPADVVIELNMVYLGAGPGC